MFGFVRPCQPEVSDPVIQSLFLRVLDTTECERALLRYNWWVNLCCIGTLKRAAHPGVIRAALEDETLTTFCRVRTNLSAAVFVRGQHAAPTPYLIQASTLPFPTAVERVVRHELLHFGAALKGQPDVVSHEILVQLLTTPEVLLLFGSLVFAGFCGIPLLLLG